jgi:hypothetical protein
LKTINWIGTLDSGDKYKEEDETRMKTVLSCAVVQMYWLQENGSRGNI